MVYLVAMALIDLGRMRIYAATRWMWLVLSGGLFVTAPLGCDSTKDVGKDAGTEMPVPEYGAPDDWDVATEQDVPSADLPQVTARTLGIYGRSDATVPFSDGELLQRLVPGAQLAAVEACGHSRFVLSSGCALAVETPHQNIEALIAAARKPGAR